MLSTLMYEVYHFLDKVIARHTKPRARGANLGQCIHSYIIHTKISHSYRAL